MRVRHVPLAQLTAQPLGLAGRDVERPGGVAGADVATADIGQLDRSVLVLHEPGGAGEREELPRAPQRVLEVRREELGEPRTRS